MDEHWFAVLLLLLVVGVVFDVWLGQTIGWRGWLHGAIVLMFLLVMMLMPSCNTDDANRPEGPHTPYGF